MTMTTPQDIRAELEKSTEALLADHQARSAAHEARMEELRREQSKTDALMKESHAKMMAALDSLDASLRRIVDDISERGW